MGKNLAKAITSVGSSGRSCPLASGTPLHRRLPARLPLLVAMLFAVLGFAPTIRAQQTADAPGTELNSLVAQVQQKLRQGKKTETELGPELKQFDGLIEKYKGQKNDWAAQVLLTKAMLYLEVFEDYKTGTDLVQQLKSDYPDTRVGKSADAVLENIRQQEQAKGIRRALAPGTKFPDFEARDLDGNPISIAKYKGKVLLIEFWAAWSGPSVYEAPNVVKAYEKYHDKGLEVVGISLDQDEAKLKATVKEKGMAWPQCYDGKGWEGELVRKYGVQSIPANYLLDRDGKVLARNLVGDALDREAGKAVAQ